MDNTDVYPRRSCSELRLSRWAGKLDTRNYGYCSEEIWRRAFCLEVVGVGRVGRDVMTSTLWIYSVLLAWRIGYEEQDIL